MSGPIILRRRFLQGCTLSAAALATPGVFAEELTITPNQTDGPFYPPKLPLDTDNDLIIVNDNITPAVGTISHFTGKILDVKGNPVRGAWVEIWQCDSNGAYLHPRSSNFDKIDANFQSFGRFLTGMTGEYYFRTIKPVPYPGRTPHIHVKVKVKGQRDFSTQCYIKGEPQNQRDGIFMSVRDPKKQAALVADYKPVAGSKIGELLANFDIVLGYTPEG
jgi:protocatechuate 3,4-dioxygenase beta subunit